MQSPLLCAIAAVLVSLTSGCASTTASAPPAAAPLLGQWRSVSFEGEDVPPGIRQVEFEFRSDGTFRAVATGLAGGTPTSQVREGTYEVTGGTIAVQVPGQPKAPVTPFSFEGDELILEDPGLDSRVRFRRVR